MKVGIVGSGFVGAAAGYAMVLRNSCREIVFLDANKDKAEAEASDIQHATPVSHPVLVRAGDYADLKGAKVVVVTAGVNQRPGENRLDLIGRNIGVFNSIIPRITEAEPEAVILIATNPVDLLTTVTERLAQLRPGQVFGSGTTLDTARFRALVAEYVGIDAHHVHGYVVGEHGDSEVVVWSSATVAGISIGDYCASMNIPWTKEIQNRITENIRSAAYSIIKGKGATYYGIGAVLANITERIVRDQRAILTVSGMNEQYPVALSMPRVVGGKGIIAEIGLFLNEDEQRLMQSSAIVLSDALKKMR
ncbi:MAG: L-lactate dehydrogenase [Bacteroidetes bacterium]|nr:L-lactate dehydrogenase [Bacteroidota bacterium]